MTSGAKSPVTIQQFSDHFDMNVSYTGNVLQVQGIIFTAKLQGTNRREASLTCLFNVFLSSIQIVLIAGLNRDRQTERKRES
jgi:hypothetical protein